MKKSAFIIALFSMVCFVATAQKFGYVDTKYILSHVPEYQSAQAEVNKLSAQWQKEIESKYETITKLESALQAEKILLTEEMRRKRQEEIDSKKQEAKDMQKQKFGVDGELFRKREELVKPIQDQIYEAIQEVASTSALMVIFDKANHSNMLYTNPKHDISDKVLKKMGLKPGEIIEEEGDGEEGGESEEGTEGTKPGGKDAPKGTSGNKGTQPRSPQKGKG